MAEASSRFRLCSWGVSGEHWNPIIPVKGPWQILKGSSRYFFVRLEKYSRMLDSFFISGRVQSGGRGSLCILGRPCWWPQEAGNHRVPQQTSPPRGRIAESASSPRALLDCPAKTHQRCSLPGCPPSCSLWLISLGLCFSGKTNHPHRDATFNS